MLQYLCQPFYKYLIYILIIYFSLSRLGMATQNVILVSILATLAGMILDYILLYQNSTDAVEGMDPAINRVTPPSYYSISQFNNKFIKPHPEFIYNVFPVSGVPPDEYPLEQYYEQPSVYMTGHMKLHDYHDVGGSSEMQNLPYPPDLNSC